MSILFSDHNYDAEQLSQIGARIKKGEQVSAPDAYFDEFDRALHAQDDEKAAQAPPAKASQRGDGKGRWPRVAYLWSLATHQRRNELATNIIHALRRGERPDFALYLRAFSDDKARFNRQSERLLAQTLGDRIPLLGLTGVNSPLGMARIRSTDEEWYQDFLLLATRAIIIFVQAPSITAGQGDFDRHVGLMKELRTLYDRGLLGRTALVQSGGLFSDIKYAELVASDGKVRKLQPSAVRELVTSYRQFVSLDPPRPATGMLLAWKIMFDPDVRGQHSL